MKNSKRVIAGAMALLSAVSVASCGSSSGGDSSSSYVDKVKVASTDDIATIPDGSEKELEWLSYFDINPTKKEPEKRTDLTLFEEKGGKIKYSQTSSMNKYDKLAARLMSNNPPDMFWYEQSMTFPANCIKEMFSLLMISLISTVLCGAMSRTLQSSSLSTASTLLHLSTSCQVLLSHMISL